jgi:hypothetical protein
MQTDDIAWVTWYVKTVINIGFDKYDYFIHDYDDAKDLMELLLTTIFKTKLELQ